jgi:hypothetical protein
MEDESSLAPDTPTKTPLTPSKRRLSPEEERHVRPGGAPKRARNTTAEATDRPGAPQQRHTNNRPASDQDNTPLGSKVWVLQHNQGGTVGSASRNQEQTIAAHEFNNHLKRKRIKIVLLQDISSSFDHRVGTTSSRNQTEQRASLSMKPFRQHQ